MSYSLEAYLVDEQTLRSVCGSGGETWTARLLAACEAEPKTAGALGASSAAEAVKLAIRQLVSGAVPAAATVHHIGVLRLICREIGDLRSAGAFEEIDSSLLDAVDDVVAAAGIAGLNLGRLSENGPPACVPGKWPPLGIPSVGHFSASQAAGWAASLDRADLSAEESEVEDALGELSEWVHAAAAPGKVLVLFYV